MAGLKSVKESLINPVEYWNNNVSGSLSLFEVMLKNSCFNLVFSNSATVYGNPKEIPILENSFTNPINTYGKTKLTVENIINDLANKYFEELNIIILRYFNPIGAHFSGLIGENYNFSSGNIFPNILRVALKKEKYLKIFGNDWQTCDGTAIRDFIHIMDLAEGHISAIEFLKNNSHVSLTLNLGSGVKTSILDLIKNFENENHVEIPFKYFEKRPGDTPILLANCKLAENTIDWKVERDLAEMCKDGWNFAKINSHMF